MSDKNPFDDPSFGLDSGKQGGTEKNVFDDQDYGKDPSALRSAADSVVSTAASVATGAELVANAFGADNSVSDKLGDAAKYVRGFESGGRRAERDARAEKIKAAEESGSAWEEVKANVGAFTEAPIDTTLEALGTSLPTIAATALTRGRGRVVAGSGMGAAQGAGAVKGSIYDAVEQEYLQAGATPEEAAARAAEAQSYSGDNIGQIALGTGLGAVAGSTGVEGAVGRMIGQEAGEAAAKGLVRSTLTGAAKEAPIESLQGGQERLAANLALQNEGFDTPTWQGVAGSSALEGIAGGVAGGGFGAAESLMAGSPQAPAADPLATDPLSGGEPAGAAPAVDDPAPPVPESPQADPYVGTPPPSVPDQYRSERFAAPAPEPVTPSQQMGLDPAAGPMSAAAALAVDTGASQQVAEQAALQQAAEIAQQQAKGKSGPQPRQGELIDNETGEIINTAEPVDRASELQERIAYIRNQAKSSGWDRRLVEAREAAETELSALQPQSKAEDAARQVLATGGTEADATRAATDSLIGDMEKTPGISIAQDAPAAVEAAKQAPKAPTSVQEGIAQVRAEKAEASAAPADIKAVIAKQIPQMTDAELQQAVAHYGPEHKRTAKLNKELAKRGVQPSQQPMESANANEPQGAGAPIQPTQGTQAAPLQEQPGIAAQSQPAPADVAPAAPVADSGSRWDGMTPAERQALAAKAGVKPVFAKNLPNAGWDRIGASVRAKLSEAMDPELTASLAESKSGAQELAARAAAYEARKIEGRDIGNGWAEFSKESGTLSVPRSEMPQIKAEHRGAMVNFLNARGIAHQEETVPATSLKPTQAEFSREKVAKAKAFEGGNRSILVSSDGHVLDGHHQWMASREKGEDVKVIRLDAPIRDLVQAAHEFPSSTTDQAAANAGMAPEAIRSAIEDSYYDQDLEGARQALRDAMPTEPGPGAKAEPQDSTPTVAAAPEAAPEKPAGYGAKNKLVSLDRREEIKRKLRGKAGQLNSGIDPEVMALGAELAVFHIEAGTRKFADFATAMVEDIGEKFIPYLRSFYDAARSFPGLDTEGMTPYDEAAKLHAAMLTPQVRESVSEAVGTVAEKPKARTKKTGAKGDMVLTQDWGVEHIDGYGDSDRETGNDTKDAFLKESRNYLNAVADALRAYGFEPHLDRKGKPEKPVSVNESGVAGSGDISLTMTNPDNGNNVYIHIGDTALRGVVPSTPSGIAIMYRVGPGTDRYASKAGNTWAPVDLSANDLAALVNSRVRPAQKNEGTTNAGTLQTQELPRTDTGEAKADAATGNRNSEPLDDGLAGSRQGADRGERVPAGTAGAGGSRADGVQQSGQSAPGTARDSGPVRTEQQPADPVADPATAETSPKPELDQPADFNLAGEDIGKGGLTKKYRENIAAIRILKAMESENRVATPEERKQIARYVGWGALKGVFDPQNKQWSKEYTELKELLTDAEYKAARASTLNAHYTSPTVVGGIFEALDQLGFTKGRVLEPSVGTGNFFGLMPAKVRKASQLHGVELDPLTSQIAAALYPSAKIAKATGFQDFQVPAEYFDLAVGNPPFGSEPLVDDDRSPYSGASIHNYFFAKSIDKLRPGGLLAMVVSHNFLDAKNDTTRRWIAERANLVSAVRLPRTAFKENAGTDVVTDILIFQKKTESERVNGLGDASWVNTTEVRLTNPKTGEESAHQISSYFEQNPRNVLGTPSAGGSMYRANEYTVEPLERSLEDSLTGWVIGLPQGIYQAVERTHEAEAADVEIPDGIKVGSYFVAENGSVQIRGNDVMGNRTASAWTAPNAKAAERMKGMIGLRDALRAQMRLERSPDATEDQIEAGRAELNRLYDAFQSKLGFLNDPTNRRIFLDDTESALLLALEFDYDRGVSKAVAEREEIEPRAPSAVKADIFKRRVMFPPADNIKVSSAKDALLASLNHKGRLDLDYMASLYDKQQAEILSELGDVVFDDPLNGLVMADEYLSGDVKTKLAEAEAAALDNPTYKRNVDALKKVIPADKRPSEIHAALGAPFIPAELFEQFAKEVTGATVKIAYIKATGQWIVDARSEANATLNVGKWGISKMPATAILSRTMAGQGVVVTETHRNADGSTTTVVLERETEAAREKQAAMKAEWQRWLWADADRADMVAGIYNEKMNRIVPRQYDGAHMTFPGMSPAIELLPHQKNAVWRGLQARQVLLDHVVGAGKTFEVVALFMEMRRLGIARKPFIAVPNHLTLQWRSEFSRLYPAANVLAATPDDFAKGNREKFFSKIITGDWDAVIVGHSSLKKIALPAETEKAVLEEQISEIAGAIEDMKRARGDRNIIRDMEGIKARLEAKMKQRIQALGERDKVVTFDELGVDAFAVDELHEFKNLFYNSTMERVPGMGNPAGSDKAFDLFVKMQWMFDTLGDKAPITGATGTPVSNSLVEMFNMQRFLQYPMLKREGLHVFDAWAKQFGSVESLYEVSPSGTGYRQSSRFAKFKNLPALMAHYQTFADTVTLDDLKAQEESRGKSFPVPKVAGGRPVNVVAKRSPQVASFMGVPELDIQNGAVQFGFNAAQGDEAIIEPNADQTAFTVQVRHTNEDGQPITMHLGSAKTEEDARLVLMEAALSPKIKVDPESILGKFGRLRELNKATKGKVNALSLTGQANKAGLDYRLIDPSAPDFSGSKINLAVDRVLATYKQWDADKGTQLVFCDLSVPLSSRSGFGSKERRIYVRDNGAITHKRGTMHTVAGHEGLPFFLVKEGSKDAKSFAIYDAATGLRVHSGLPAKAVAIDWAGQILADDAKRQRWIDARDNLGDIEQEAIDDYNNANEIDTEETEAISLADIAGVSGATGFSVYDDIKAKLIAKGIPEREIAFIHDYGTPAAKDKLFKAVNNGSVRVLLGSTPKMGAGTNVQKRLVALHHIDAPWRPSDLEQREGRIIRRGNELYDRDPANFEVGIYRYATEQTYDTRRWQILEHKARGIEQLRKYDGTLNEIDDIEGEAANSADMKAAASGDPLILEETQLRNEVRRLESLQASHADESQSMVRRARDQARFANEWGPRVLAQFERLKKDADAHPVKKDEFAGLTVDGKQIGERDAAVEAIKKVMNRVLDGGTATFTYRGIDFTLTGNSSYAELESPTGKLDNFRMQFEAMPSAAGFLTRFANYINRIPAHIAELESKIAEAKVAAEELREQSSKPFTQEEELSAAREAHKRVQRRLIAKGPDIPAAQRPMLEQAMEQQKEALRDQGFGESLDEFLGSNQDRLRYSFAGRWAQGADLLSLRTAQRRIAVGENAETVRQETGWHRGADGKWRFEISDDQAEIAVGGKDARMVFANAQLNALVDGRPRIQIGDVLDHPQLFAAYPSLAEIELQEMPEGVTALARVHQRATGVVIQVQPGMPRARLASALLHELQRGIQKIEGFARDGSAKALQTDFDPTGVKTYRRLAGEVEARNTQARQVMTPKLRQMIAPEETADVPASDVIVLFNGERVKAEPQNIGGAPITEQSLKRAFDVQFPRLAPAVRKMLARGKAKQRGGLVLIDSADPARIAAVYARNTGRSLDDSIDLFEEAGKINGFYDAKSGLTFLVGPNLNPVTGPAVLLHEMTHGQQRKKLDKHAGAMLMNRGQVKNADLRAFLDRVAERMIDAGETANEQEAAAYIVEQAVMEGRSKGYAVADSRFLAWVDQAIGQRVGDFLRSFLGMVRSWMLRNGMPIGEITVDDLVGYAMAGVERAAAGSVAATDAAPAFSRSGVREIAGKATAELNKTFNIPGKLHWWHKTVGTMYNLAERSPFFKPVFESAQGFIDDVAHYAADAAERAPKLLPRLETWRDIAKTPISAEDNKAIARPIFEGTLMWTRDDDGKPVRVQSLADAAANLSTDEKADILLAQGKIPEGMLRAWKALSAEQYAKMIDSRYESQMLKPGIVWSDAELRSIFNLNDEQVGLYQEFRDATNRSLDTMARADLLRFGGEDVKELRDAVMDAVDVRAAAMLLRDHLAKMADSWPDRATQLLQTAHGMMERADKVAELQAEGYAPLSRFGKYTVDVVENGERQYFGLFETKREANKMAEQMRAEFGQDSVTQGTLSDESFKLFAGITPESLELFGNMLGLDSTGDSAQDQAFQEYLRLTKTNRSAMRRLIHRKGIAGYSEDVGRVLASFVYSNARQTAAGLHMGDLGDAVNKIPKEQGELKDAAVRLSEYIKNPQEEAQAVRGLLFAQYLGGSVASAFVNMTQPFAVTFPWLSQHGGARKAAAELTKAAKQMSTKGHQYEADLAAALKDAEDDGVVSPQEVHQLMAQARGSGSLRAGDGTRVGEARAVASNAVARMSVAWGKLFGAAEQVNRRITFIAAYRVAKSQGMADPDAFARHAVMETQFVYSKASKMQWGRGAIGGTLMTFKTYSVAYMEMMSRLWTQGEPGSQERKEGRKAALLMIATLMLMGGAGGLPFAEDVEDLIDGLAQLAGYNFSTQKAKEAFLIDVFGEEIAHFIDKGVSGLPGAPMDVSGRLGMGNLIPGTGLFQERTSHTRDVLEIAGPMGDFANRIATGSRKILGGDVGAGLLEMSPVAVRNLAKGADMSVTGMYRDTKGYKVLDTNLLEAALKSVGFQPESVARVQEANWLNQRGKAFYNMKAQEIRSMWAAGIFEKDDAKVQRAREAIADWNAKNPEQPMLIRIPDIMRRVREMAKTKDQRIADTAPKAMRVQMREDVARLRSTMED